jgi:hypothetical protein
LHRGRGGIPGTSAGGENIFGQAEMRKRHEPSSLD